LREKREPLVRCYGPRISLSRSRNWGFESRPANSTPKSWGPVPSTIGSNEFRNRFGYYLERAAAGAEISITRHGKPFARLSPPDSLFEAAAAGASSDSSNHRRR
jgi:prevent-host-death family protein